MVLADQGGGVIDGHGWPTGEAHDEEVHAGMELGKGLGSRRTGLGLDGLRNGFQRREGSAGP
jgi:hypothetical protein